MVSFIDRLENERVKEWYTNHKDPSTLSRIVLEAERKGYILDPKSGLFMREVCSKDTTQKIGHTIIDIIFPRPTDIHFHEDVGEAVVVIGGSGFFYSPELTTSSEPIAVWEGYGVFIPQKVLHGFSPSEDEYLEIGLNCTGIFNPEQEKIVESFDYALGWARGGKFRG